MITLSGQPTTLTAGYNPVYFYADSTNKYEPNFRYLVDVYNLSTNELLSRQRIKPRFGDSLLEVNIQKILSSELAYSVKDFIQYEIPINSFNNTPSSGFKYGIEFGEQYAAPWQFDDTFYYNGYVGLIGSTLPPYSDGDYIQVTNAAEYITFEDNFFDSGAVGFTFPSGHPFNIGDTVYILQDYPYTNPSYQGYTTITNTTPTTVTTNKPFIQNTPVEGGTMIRNYEYDGLQQVSGVTMSGSNYIVVTYQPWIDNSPAHSGSTQYNDGRLIDVTGVTSFTGYTFNGAQSVMQYRNFNSDEYDPFEPNQKFLTTMPRTIKYPVKLTNNGYLDLWTRDFESIFKNYSLELNTYDVNNTLIDTFIGYNPYDITVGRTQIQTVSVGPANLNIVAWETIQNGSFSTSNYWTLTAQTGGQVSISGGTLNYYDPVGDGEGYAIQSGVLDVGCSYEVILTTSNNNFVGVQVGDDNNTVSIVPAGISNGVYSAVFTAETENFWIVMSSSYAGENGVNIDNVEVIRLCPVIDCNVDHYTITVNEFGNSAQTETLTFDLDCDCTRYTNYELIFMDKYGSFLPINFELNSTSNINISREMTKNFVGKLDDNRHKINTAEHSMRPFYTEISERWTLNSNWISEDLMEYMEELFSSPIAYININNLYHSVNVVETTFERKRKNNVKNIMYTITIELSLNDSIQTG